MKNDRIRCQKFMTGGCRFERGSLPFRSEHLDGACTADLGVENESPKNSAISLPFDAAMKHELHAVDGVGGIGVRSCHTGCSRFP
jgi:hypothetical protein